MEAWWLRLGIAVTPGRPLHPQTHGKLARVHRTIWAEVQGIRDRPDLATAQRRCDAWRARDNGERPHEALADAVPAERYQLSARPFPAEAPPIVYRPDDAVRQVQGDGTISFRGHDDFISHGVRGLPVAIRRTRADDPYGVWSGQRQVTPIDLTEHA